MVTREPCPNCPCHMATMWCSGCSDSVCEPCWKEHNQDGPDHTEVEVYRKPYMVSSYFPPEGVTDGDELLVSVTIEDVIEAWEAYQYATEDTPSHWADLPVDKQGRILKAVTESGVDLFTIFDLA